MLEVEGKSAYIKEYTFGDLPGYIPLTTKKCGRHVIFPTSANLHSHKMKSIDSAPKIKFGMKRNISWEPAKSYCVAGF